MDLIRSAHQQGQAALSEYQSSQVICSYGIPVAKDALVQSVAEAACAADAIGYPVVLKACSPELMHKSESGSVALDIRSRSELEAAYARIHRSVDIELDGVLVQEMVYGPREMVLGLNRDPQFGPCVMLGLGGMMTEIIRDTVFRVAPLDLIEAREMTSELQSKDILGAFRGQAPADRETICRSLIALGQIGMDHKAVSEIDINPMIISPTGRVVAVDALVVFGA